ncbi:GFA family protein [Aestuariibius insulae]|uniref:GFA family protein n=1 Tax=Aestuariibius insulae TaxID=2058287 RepID=UPI00345E8819
MREGSCLCGAVTFTVEGEIAGVSVCHCGQCRKQSGHVWASGWAKDEAVTISGDVRWFDAVGTAKRGFCPTCGSFLFWVAHDEDTISFAMGALDGATGLSLGKHIFVRDKGDYYDITDGLPQRAQ